jgi:TolB-like protein/DNA-binding winged helix-turn-helix (wHTH) protein/Tfp pilus assembly protein PilF
MPPSVRFGLFEVDLRTGEIRKRGVAIGRLQEQPLQVLAALAQQPGQLVTREELRQRLWPGDVHVDFERGLNKAVQKLREALGDSADAPRFIETIPRRGYRFLASIENAEAVVPGRLGTTVRSTVLQGVVLLVIPAAIALGLWLSERAAGRAAPPPVAVGRSIAVLPLENLSGTPADEFFSDGITEELITKLSKIRGLKVISRGSVFRLEGKNLDPREVGRQLGASAVLEGSVRKGKDSVRVLVRLVNAEDGRVLWSHDSNERAIGDIFTLQDEVAQRVVARFSLTFVPDGRERQGTENLEAYHAYLKGRFFWNKRTGEGFRKAIEHFQNAIQKDPNYAAAHAGLADTYVLKRVFATLEPGETLRQMEAKARAAAERSLNLDETLAEAHASLGMIKALTENDEAGIEREYRRAIELNPNYATAHHWYALFLNDLNRFEEALAAIERAQEIDPFSLVINSDVGIILSKMHQYDRAIEQFQRTIEMDPAYPDAHAMLGWACTHAGRYDQAISEFEKARSLLASPATHLDGLIYANSRAGNRREALRLLKELEGSESRRALLPWQSWVVIYVAVGDLDKAYEILDRTQREGVTIKAVLNHPSMDGVRAQPRFARLAQRAAVVP